MLKVHVLPILEINDQLRSGIRYLNAVLCVSPEVCSFDSSGYPRPNGIQRTGRRHHHAFFPSAKRNATANRTPTDMGNLGAALRRRQSPARSARPARRNRRGAPMSTSSTPSRGSVTTKDARSMSYLPVGAASSTWSPLSRYQTHRTHYTILYRSPPLRSPLA